MACLLLEMFLLLDLDCPLFWFHVYEYEYLLVLAALVYSRRSCGCAQNGQGVNMAGPCTYDLQSMRQLLLKKIIAAFYGLM